MREHVEVTQKPAPPVPEVMVPEPAFAPVKNVSKRDMIDLVRMFWPRNPALLPKIRIGSPHDGGYVLPVMALTCDAVLSIGIGNNASFDLELAEYGMTVLQFDHTIAQPPAAHENFRFHRYGWGASTEGKLLSFHDIMSLFRRLSPQRSILKFDIEGNEFATIATTDAVDLAAFDIIVCEVHDLHRLADRDFFNRAKGLFAALARHHTPIHLHPNNYRDPKITHGVLVPDVVELTYMRNDYGPFSGFSSDAIPGIFDRPNNPAQSDIELTKLLSQSAFRAITLASRCDGPTLVGG